MAESGAPEWRCDDCDWVWPYPFSVNEDSECDNCGGEPSHG
jgi:hypothetical protein